MIKTAAAVPAVSAGKAGFHRDSTGKEQAALRRPERERSRQMRWLKKIIEAENPDAKVYLFSAAENYTKNDDKR